MNYPFKINYNNGIIDSIEYNKETNYKDNFHADNIYQNKQTALNLLCDIVNSNDPYHFFYKYKSSGRTDEANKLIGIAQYFVTNAEKESFSAEQLLSNPAFKLSFNLELLPIGWIKKQTIRDLADRFQNEIFYFGVKYSIASGTLIFINDPFISNSTKSHCSLTSDKEYSDFVSNTAISQIPLSLQFAYSPYQYQIYRRFERLCELLHLELTKLIPNQEDTGALMTLYLQSREFVLFHLEMLLKKYHPDSIIQNSFCPQKNDLVPLLDVLQTSFAKKSQIPYSASDLCPNFSDFLSMFLRNHKNSVLNILIDSLKEDEFFNKSALDHAKDIIASNNEIINKLYDTESRNKYLTSIKYFVESEAPTSYIMLSSVEFTDCITHEKTVSDIMVNLPIPIAEYYDANGNSYVSSCLDILSVIYHDPLTPFLKPIFFAPEINAQTFFMEIDQKHHTKIYRTIKDAYSNSAFAQNPYFKTASLGVVLYELLKAINTSKTDNIRRCAECHKYFVPKHAHERYCDSPSRKKGSSPVEGNCSFKAKQKLEKNRQKPVRQLYNLRRNQHPRIDNACDYFRNIEIDINTDITTEYAKFIFFLKQCFLLDYLYKKERSYICNALSDCIDEERQKALKNYGKSFFPTNAQFKKESLLNLPTKNCHVCTFYEPARNSIELSSHIYHFDWDEVIPLFISSKGSQNKAYISFRDKLADVSSKYTSVFIDLPNEVIASFKYLSTLDKTWGQILTNDNDKSDSKQTACKELR